MDTRKQVDYWKTSADEDFSAAQSLLEKGHLRHSLFFAHLAIEKMLKAHVAVKTSDLPPRIHNLVRLAEIAGLRLDTKKTELLYEFGVYQLEGRYPDSEQIMLDLQTAKSELLKAKELLEWLKTQL
jgi:HEPN domain-containing protein